MSSNIKRDLAVADNKTALSNLFQTKLCLTRKVLKGIFGFDISLQQLRVVQGKFEFEYSDRKVRCILFS